MASRKSKLSGDPRFDLTTECAACGYKIPPAEIVRTGWSTIRCPKCLAEFEEAKPSKNSPR